MPCFNYSRSHTGLIIITADREYHRDSQDLIAVLFQAAGLFTAGMETQAFEMQSHALSFNFFCKQSSVLSSLDFMFSSKANSTGHSSVAPAKKCQKMHHTGSDAQVPPRQCTLHL